MRAFGYSPATAIADLVDNSITAGARSIVIRLHWAGAASWVSITDDGGGMSEDGLRSAMTLGSRDPREARNPHDLGRFGLGLKTASFSQCRSLTVASHAGDGDLAVRRWDLDEVARSGEWRLLTAGPPGVDETASSPPADGGTVVLWTRLDRLVGEAEVEDDRARERFLQTARRVEAHLGMVFHRFLAASNGPRISINGHDVTPWDPFMAGHPATQQFPPETLFLRGRPVEVTGFVLPHQSKLSPEERDAGRGPEGWNAHQGFYVYRERRLLVAGDWLRLGPQKDEHAKLARIRIDLPNDLDEDWQIDVRKATARPPGPLRDRLRQIGEIVRARAVEIYRHRGKEVARRHAGDAAFVWRQLVRRGKIVYAINREHPMVAEALENLPGVEGVLRLAEETVPVPLIALQATERGEDQAAPFEGADTEVRTMARAARDALLERGHSPAQVTAALMAMEPFAFHPEVVVALEEDGR
jgi:hypothetical protein